MNRVTITRNKAGEVVAQDERLQRAPSGNAQQRQKALRSGWKPAWLANGQPRAYTLPPLGMLEPPPEIEAARIIALCTREAVMRTPEQTARLRETQRRKTEAANCKRIAETLELNDSIRVALEQRAAELEVMLWLML